MSATAARLSPSWEKLGRSLAAGCDWARTAYVVKAVAAALLALLISLLADLDSPRTAMFAVYLVMQAQSGLVFQKSYYRLLGTVVGAVVSVILISAFAQAPELFFLAFALWVAVCTAGSFVFRNFQSYGFVLSGYTVCFVALPAITSPTGVFGVAATRVIEMFVGVFCAAVVSDTLFPQRMADVVSRALASRFSDFADVLRQAPARLRAGDTGKTAMLRFAGDALGLESARANTGLESSDLRRQRLRLKLLNHEFMAATSTLHAFHQTLRRLRSGGHPAVAAALFSLYDSLGDILDPMAEGGSDADAVLRRLDPWRRDYRARVSSVRSQLPEALTRIERLDFDSGAEVLARLADEFRAYCATQASLAGKFPAAADRDEPSTLVALRRLGDDADGLRFSTRTDPLLAALAALRGVAVMAVTAGFWLASGGVWGVGPIMNGVASGTIFATLPSPARVVRQALAGWALALPLGLLWNFFLIPQATDWVGLCLLLVPPLALIAWLSYSPKLLPVGMGMSISFMLHVSLDRSFNADLPAYLEASFADFLGFACAGILYAVIDPNAGPWGRRRIVGALRRQMADICRGQGRLRRETLESSSRDLVQRIATRGHLADDTDHWVFDWLLTVLEIGRAVIDLRAVIDGQSPERVPFAVSIALQRLGELFEQPSAAHREQAAAAVESAIGALVAEAGEELFLLEGYERRALLLDLHFIRSAIADAASILDGTGD